MRRYVSGLFSSFSIIPSQTLKNICVSWFTIMGAAVAVVLRGPLSGSAGVAQQGLWAIRNLAVCHDNKRLLEAAGTCEGERVLRLNVFFDIKHVMHITRNSVFMFCSIGKSLSSQWLCVALLRGTLPDSPGACEGQSAAL